MTAKINRLVVKNFTAFEQVELDFSLGLNLLLGTNGTGKTHLMKIIYSLLQGRKIVDTSPGFNETQLQIMNGKIKRIFQSEPEALRRNKNLPTLLELTYQPDEFIRLEAKPNDIFIPTWSPQPVASPKVILPTPIYLPAQEFLSINEGFIAIYQHRELPYDETFYDLSVALNALPLRQEKLEQVQPVLAHLRQVITGQAGEEELITQENGRFKFSMPEGKLDIHLIADGYRKLGTLYQLLRNGSLTANSILFWDEPEANLNPSLVLEVVKILQNLVDLGMQIFIATHDYLLSYELSLLAENPETTSPNLRFFSLHKPNRREGVQIEAAETLADIEHNLILDAFAAHYDREAALF